MPLALRSTESDELLSFVRENYPDYDDVPDDELRKRLAAKPQGLVRAIRSKYADAYMHLDDERLTERVVAKLEGRLPKSGWKTTEPAPIVRHLLTGQLTSPQSQATLAKTYGQFPADVASVVGETIESFTTPLNALIGVGLGKASPAVRGATSATFGAEALNSIRLQYPQLRQAIDEERWGDAAKEALRLGLYSAFALFMGKHAKAQTKLYQPPKAVLAGAPKAVPFTPPAPEAIKAAETVAATRRVAGAPPIEVPSPETVAAAERVRTQRLDAAHAEQAKVTTRIRELEEVKKQRQDAGDRSGADDAERQLKPLREQHGEQQLTLSRLEGRGLPKPVPAEEPVEAPPPTPITELTKRAEEPQPQGPSDAELADLPFAAATEPRAPTPPEEKGLPKWVSENIDTLNDEAVNAGVADDIEQLSAQRLTAGQIAKTLSVEKATVYAVRAKRGIPSMDSKTEFETWLRDRQAPPSDAARGMTTRPKQAGEVLTSDELRPEVRERIIVRGALTQLSDTLDDMRGQVGIYRSEVAGGKPDEWTGIKSPLPKELQQGFKWDEIQRIIKKGLAGEKLTPRQRAYFNDLTRWAKKKGGQVGPEDVAELIAKHDLPLKSELEPEPEPDTSFPFGANAPEMRQPTAHRPSLSEVELEHPGAPQPESDRPPFVETPAGDVVKPNPPADPSLRALADEQIEQLAGSTNDQKIGEALAKLMGVERPVVVTRGDIMVAQTTSSTGMHQIVLPQQAGASTLYHEMRHAAANEGKGPPVTENAKDLELGEFLSQQEARKKAAGLPPPPQPPAPGAPPPSGGELPKYARSINLNRVNSVDEIKQQILEDAKALPEHKTLTLEEAAKKALEEGMTIADTEKFSRSYKQTHNKVMRARNAALAAYERFNQAAKALQDAPKETPELLENMRVAFSNRLAAVQAWNDIAHEAGLTLSLFRTQVEPFAAQARMAKAVDKLLVILGEKGKLSDEIVRRAGLLNWESPREVQTFLHHLSPLVSSRPDRVFEWYMNSLLSGPKTHEANMLGNFGSVFVYRPLTQGLAGAAEQVRAGVRGETPRAFAAEALYRYKGMFSSLKDAVTVFLRTMRTEIPESGLSKFGETTPFRGPAIEGRLRVGSGEPMGPNLGRLVRLPGTFLKAADDFGRTVGERGAKYSYLYREGRQSGLKDGELDRYVLEEANKPHPEIDIRAEVETTEDLYQSPLGKSGGDLMRLRDDTWFGRFVAPFLRIGINLPKYQFGYTGPANLFKLWYLAKKGRLPVGPDLTNEIAKTAIGSAIAMWVVNEAASGNITGGGPSDYRQRREWENSGWLPYSKRKDDGSYFSYARSPVGITIGVLADLAEVLQLLGEAEGRGDLDAKQKETMRDAVIGKSVAAIANNVTNQTFVKGVSDLFDIFHDPEQFLPRIAGQFIGANVAPTIVANVAEALDPYVRESRSFMDEIKKRIPVARQTLPAMRDIRGRPVEAAGAPMSRMFNIFRTREPRGGVIQKKIVDLGLGWDRLDRVFNIKNNRIELTNDEYDDFNETSGRRVDIYLRALERPETWTAFNRLSEEQQADTIKKMVEKGRREGKQEYRDRNLVRWMREGRVR